MGKKINLIKIFVFSVAVFFIGFIIGENINIEPQGIGGFVYKEISWQDQTINIIEENCDFSLHIQYDEQTNKKRLSCFKKECKDEYCKQNRWFSPVWTPIK